MLVKVLRSREYEACSWALCTANLYDYLTHLNKDFYEFQIQRRIVKNGYLDGLYNTIVNDEPISIITLSSSEGTRFKEGDEIDIDMKTVDILDGLQRTFRLWMIVRLDTIISANNFRDFSEFKKWIRDENNSEGEQILSYSFVSIGFLKKVFDKVYRKKVLDAFKEYEMVLSLWDGLDDMQVVEKMLVLNAGQRPVSSVHQYEILFLHYFDKNVINVPGVTLLRERDKDYYKLKKNQRSVGEYPLSAIIVALQSFINQKPLRIVPANRIVIEADEELSSSIVNDYFTPDFLNFFVNSVYELDKALCRDPAYISWVGKDTTLSGIYSAIGKYSNTFDVNDSRKSITRFVEDVSAGRIDFNLGGFYNAYGELSSTRVNVGNVVRQSIFKYTIQCLENGKPRWNTCFEMNQDND